MRRSVSAKFPNSVQLFKFCHRVLSEQRGGKVHDQEVGAILSFNPSDCSHWKRGEKNVKSVFSLAKLADTLKVETGLVHDIASGVVCLDEAYFEYQESTAFQSAVKNALSEGVGSLNHARERIETFVETLHRQADFSTAPLYLPEVMRFFSFIGTQPMDMMDKLSRILRVRPGQYMIHFRKGDLKPQTRMSIAKDLARIVLGAERARFPELGPAHADAQKFEEYIFTASLLAPKQMVLSELAKLDSRRNLVAELAALFWVPKSLVGFQMQDILRSRDATAQKRQDLGRSDTVGIQVDA